MTITSRRCRSVLVCRASFWTRPQRLPYTAAMDHFGPPALLLVLAAPAVGSFVALIADRVPRGESIVWPGSACRACGQRLGPTEMVPLLSFAMQSGRCRTCNATIPPWVLYTEILALAAASVSVIIGGTVGAMWLMAVVLWTLLALALCDLLWFRLPDSLTLLLLTLAMGYTTSTGADFWLCVLGAAIGTGSFMVLRIGYRLIRGREGLGLGDVKLMAGLGALVGPQDIPVMVLMGALFALFTTIASGRKLKATRPLPFGAALCAAGASVWLYQSSQIV